MYIFISIVIKRVISKGNRLVSKSLSTPLDCIRTVKDITWGSQSTYRGELDLVFFHCILTNKKTVQKTVEGVLVTL